MAGSSPHEAVLRTAVHDLLRRVEDVRHDLPDGPDLRRLFVDAARVAEDVDLLLGPDPASTSGPVVLEVISDADYPPEFFGDAEDEGVGRHR